MNSPPFTLRWLPTGDLCIDGDCGLPPLAEQLGRLDVDGDMPRVGEAAGLVADNVVVDCGAFIGDTAIKLHDAFGVAVHAFEPFLDAFTAMLYNSRGRSQFHAHNQPTGNGERVKLVYSCPGPNLGMRSVMPDDGPDSIPTFRIDELELPHCRLLKVDVEGSEIPTLLGAAETIRRCRPFLYVEHFVDGQKNRGYTPEQLVETIKGLGYGLEMFGEPPRWDWFCRPL